MDFHSVFRNKNFLCVSLWGSRFGGGEAFLLETCKWALSEGARNVAWISFEHAEQNKNVLVRNYHKPYDSFRVRKLFVNAHQPRDGKTAYAIDIPGGFDKTKLKRWMKLLSPDIVHHQGHRRLDIMECCVEQKVNFITGYHFWSGVVALNAKMFNKDIFRNIEMHKEDDEYKNILDKKDTITTYVVSKYMQDIIQNVTSKHIENICYPFIDENDANAKTSSFPASFIKKWTDDKYNRSFVTIMNLHKNKGGKIFLKLINETDLPCQGIFSEFDSEDLDQEIRDAVLNRKNAITILLNRQETVNEIYDHTRLLLIPSEIDETFCRVAQEGLVREIPMITSGKGNLSYILDEEAAEHLHVGTSSEEDFWIQKISELYDDEKALQKLSNAAKMKYTQMKNDHTFHFKNVVFKSLTQSFRTNVMIFTPWSDQGLGIQSRHYRNILIKNGFKVFIFAYKPYFSSFAKKNQESSDRVQALEMEWETNDEIYYSENDREHVTDEELCIFLKKYRDTIGTCIIPEICFHRVFEIARYLKERHYIRVLAIPNIEIVRKKELKKFSIFDKILCNNQLCFDLLKKFNFSLFEKEKLFPFGFAFEPRFPISSSVSPVDTEKDVNEKKLKFLLIGGFNTVHRKQADKVMNAFEIVLNDGFSVELTITSQCSVESLKKQCSQNIRILEENLSYTEIKKLYEEHDVTIQVSKHEGLGLGFFESIAAGIPVISLNVEPHNEIIKEGVNGWLLHAHDIQMTDNSDSLLTSSSFDVLDMVSLLKHISNNVKEVNKMKSTTKVDFLQRYKCSDFTQKFLELIY